MAITVNPIGICDYNNYNKTCVFVRQDEVMLVKALQSFRKPSLIPSVNLVSANSCYRGVFNEGKQPDTQLV